MWHSRVNFYLFIFLLSSKILKYSTKNKSISKIKYFDLTVSYETLSYCTPTATNRNSKITAVASRLVASVLGKVFFFFLPPFPGFESQYICLSFLWCFIYLLGLHGIQ
jgi:hypothetical protein